MVMSELDAGGRKPQRQVVLWLGETTPLLEAMWPLLDILHVRSVDAALSVLERGAAACLVVDTAQPGLDLVSVVAPVRRRWPDLGVVALGDVTPPLISPGALHPDIDRYVERSARPADLAETIRYLIDQRTRHDVSEDYHALAERARHLEGLVQATFAFSSTPDIQNIVGDLREIGRVAVDADDVAVLMTNDDYSDVSDGLGLGVPEAYLQVCRQHLLGLAQEDRLFYLSDEVLLRECLPDMLPTAIRVREAAAGHAASYMRVPLNIDQRLIGFVALFSNRPGLFDGAHLQLGRLFASQVANALRNMQLYIQLNQSEQRRSAISRVTELIAEDLSLDAVLGRIVEEAARLVSGSAGMILLTRPEGDLEISAVTNLPPNLVGKVISIEAGQSGLIARTGRPHVVSDYAHWEEAVEELRSGVPQGSLVFGVPLVYRGMVLGVLQVIRQRHHTADTEEVQEVLMMLAPQAAIAIAKAQLHEIVRSDQRHLLAVLDQIPVAVAVCDAEKRIKLLNREAERVLSSLGVPVVGILGRLAVDVVHEYIPAEAVALSPLPDALEVMIGSKGEFLVHLATITREDSSVDSYVAVAQDVTEMRRMDRSKANLTRVLTHDLGNLLMLARNPIEMIDEPDITPEQHDQLREMLLGSMERMETLVRDVTDLEMADSLGSETMQPYTLYAIVEKVVAMHRSQAASQNIELTLEMNGKSPRGLRGHAVLIGQAVGNLVSNAIKYTPPGGHVVVTTEQDADNAIIRVRDSGYGIPPEKLEAIFEPFMRVKDRRTRHIQGSGLGLSIVKSFVTAHGGRVTVESELDKGSTFVIYLPLRPIEQSRVAPVHLAHLDLSFLSERTTAAPGD